MTFEEDLIDENLDKFISKACFLRAYCYNVSSNDIIIYIFHFFIRTLAICHFSVQFKVVLKTIITLQSLSNPPPAKGTFINYFLQIKGWHFCYFCGDASYFSCDKRRGLQICVKSCMNIPNPVEHFF